MSNEFRIVHLFSPLYHHGEQGIIGNKDGLRALVKLIEKALENEKADGPFFTSDGEGYDLFVKCIPGNLLCMVALPYQDDYCREDRKDAIFPWGPAP